MLPNSGPPAHGSTPTPGKSRKRKRRAFLSLLDRPLFWWSILPLTEGALIIFLYLVIFALRSGTSLVQVLSDPPAITTGFLLAGSVLSTMASIGAYRREQNLRNLNFTAELLLAAALGAGLGLFLLYVVFLGIENVARESRSALLMAAVAFAPISILLRIMLRHPLALVRRQLPLLAVGTEESLASFRANFTRTGLTNPLWEIVLTPGRPLEPPRPWEDLFGELEAVILTDPPDFLCAQDADRLMRMHFETLPVYSEANFYASRWRQVPTLHLTATWVFDQDFQLADRSSYRFIKRGIDLLSSCLLLLLGWPLIIGIALLIRCDSPGPIFYRQERVGRHLRVFRIWKFRTMKVEALPGALYTAVDDPRITRVGKLLRRLRLDELPQVYNILRGDMSLIGPRPEWTQLVKQYEKKIPGYHLRHLVRPGLTGWAQLNFPYGESLEDAEQKLSYDLYYIRHYSPVLDLEIILKTFLSVVSLNGR
jgi:exopolysaccharide biosynthesis polyprenyl glycosylphosphotransferase